jgi:type I restriction enzyme S subunit
MHKYLRAANVGWDGLILDDVKLMNFTDVEMSLFRLEPGDLLLNEASGSPREVGKPAIWRGEIEDCAFQNTLLRVRPKPIVDPRYLLQFFQHEAATGAFARGARGVGIHHLGRDALAKWPVPLPPLNEQRRIAAILDQADDLRARRRQLLECAEELPRSIFVELFGDPASNPRGLPLVPLGEVGELDRGVSRHRPRNDPALLGGPYPLIQTGDVARSGGLITQYSATYSELGLAQSKLWPAGTLCITIAANIAETGILTFDACFPDSVVGFTADKATTTFVQTWLTFLQPTLEAAAPQSAQRNINLAILRALPVPLPGPDQLQRFDQLLDAVAQENRTSREALTHHEALFKATQFLAFSGQL